MHLVRKNPPYEGIDLSDLRRVPKFVPFFPSKTK